MKAGGKGLNANENKYKLCRSRDLMLDVTIWRRCVGPEVEVGVGGEEYGRPRLLSRSRPSRRRGRKLDEKLLCDRRSYGVKCAFV